ncbi:hypothetical protein [Actinotalea sp. JY-7885]|uniref:hypothetical protein n=1 Tax=Actinotalea sp. JY-7885 TaxID=2758576 RepID=UPI00165E0598|nr:hypothetical protein [Actinotalea sp. JY-7885]
MQPHPAPDAARTLVLELTDAEAASLLNVLTTHEVAAHDERHQYPDDLVRAARLDAEEALVDRVHAALDAHVSPPVRLGLPEQQVVRLPRTRQVLAGPGALTAATAHDALLAAGQSEREAWETAAREVARELSQAVLADLRGRQTRPLARLQRALLREAAAHSGDLWD